MNRAAAWALLTIEAVAVTAWWTCRRIRYRCAHPAARLRIRAAWQATCQDCGSSRQISERRALAVLDHQHQTRTMRRAVGLPW